MATFTSYCVLHAVRQLNPRTISKEQRSRSEDESRSVGEEIPRLLLHHNVLYSSNMSLSVVSLLADVPSGIHHRPRAYSKSHPFNSTRFDGFNNINRRLQINDHSVRGYAFTKIFSSPMLLWRTQSILDFWFSRQRLLPLVPCLDLEDAGDIWFRKVGISPNYTALQPRRSYSSLSIWVLPLGRIIGLLDSSHRPEF
jgi:hypothetical protein